tara:strand:+ start:1469 stop:2641 length:1173 start_codon:yes stop_codon:yes gene_type:complete
MGLGSAFKKGFKKIGSGFKKAFKSIGKGIKSAVGKIGKFMGKIGWVGQLALMFTPVGAMLSGMMGSIGNVAGGMFSNITGALAKGGKFAQGAGKLLEAGASFAKAGHSAFRTITDGVAAFTNEFVGATLNKIPGMESLLPGIKGKEFGNLWSATENAVMENANKVVAYFQDGLKSGGQVFSATQANVVNDAVALTGKGTIPGSKAQTGMTDKPSTGETVPNTYEAYVSDSAEGVNPLDYDVSGLPDVTQATESLGGGIPAAKESLLSQVTDYGSNLYDNAVTAVQEIPGKILEAPGKFVDDIGKRVVGGIETKAMQAIGLEDKPVYETTQYNAYVPEFNMAPAGQYASTDINDRAMQIQVSGQNHYQQNPYGYGAAQYLQQMARATGGTA